MVRAMLEAMCFQTREVVDAMCKDAGLDRLEVCRRSCKCGQAGQTCWSDVSFCQHCLGVSLRRAEDAAMGSTSSKPPL